MPIKGTHSLIRGCLLTSMLFATIMTGCTGSNSAESTDSIELIQNAFDQKDFQTAAEILEDSHKYAMNSNDISRLVKFSIFYMRLADINDSEDMVGHAYQCLSRAFGLDSIATADYINTLSVEDMSQAAAVKTLLGASEIHFFHDDSEYPDSLYFRENDEKEPHQ